MAPVKKSVNMPKKSLWLVIALFLIIGNSYADKVYLKNGFKIECIVRNQNEESVEMEVGGGSMRFPADQVESVETSTPIEQALLRKKWEREALAQKKGKKEEVKSEGKTEIKTVKIDTSSGHVTVDAILNGKVTAKLLLDTGATLIVLSNNVAESLKIDTKKLTKIVELELADGRKINTKFTTLDSVSVQGVIAKDIDAAILPVGAEKLNVKDGVLGMSFLKRFSFKVDYKNNKLILEKSS